MDAPSSTGWIEHAWTFIAGSAGALFGAGAVWTNMQRRQDGVETRLTALEKAAKEDREASDTKRRELTEAIEHLRMEIKTDITALRSEIRTDMNAIRDAVLRGRA